MTLLAIILAQHALIVLVVLAIGVTVRLWTLPVSKDSALEDLRDDFNEYQVSLSQHYEASHYGEVVAGIEDFRTHHYKYVDNAIVDKFTTSLYDHLKDIDIERSVA